MKAQATGKVKNSVLFKNTFDESGENTWKIMKF